MKVITLVGLGGTGSWFAPQFTTELLALSGAGFRLLLVDPDTVETKNLLRQNFTTMDLDEAKVRGMRRQLAPKLGQSVREGGNPGLHALALPWAPLGRLVAEYAQHPDVQRMLSDATMRDAKESLVFCFADNHKARKDIIDAVYSGQVDAAIISGNDFRSAEAYLVLPEYQNTERDPLFFYPELTTGDPTRHSCAEPNPAEQSLTANVMSAACALALWSVRFGPLFRDSTPEDCLPYHFQWSGLKLSSYTKNKPSPAVVTQLRLRAEDEFQLAQ